MLVLERQATRAVSHRPAVQQEASSDATQSRYRSDGAPMSGVYNSPPLPAFDLAARRLEAAHDDDPMFLGRVAAGADLGTIGGAAYGLDEDPREFGRADGT